MAGNQHYTRNTVSVRRWCNECARFTDHQVNSGIVGHCLEVHKRTTNSPAQRPSPAQQQTLFRRNV